MARRALTTYREVLGREHPDTLRCLRNLCTAAKQLGREDAETLLRELAAAGAGPGGEETEMSALAVSDLAMVLLRTGADGNPHPFWALFTGGRARQRKARC